MKLRLIVSEIQHNFQRHPQISLFCVGFKCFVCLQAAVFYIGQAVYACNGSTYVCRQGLQTFTYMYYIITFVIVIDIFLNFILHHTVILINQLYTNKVKS